MRIASVDVDELGFPFGDGGERFGIASPRRDRFDTVPVRITAENGLTGWGERFSYSCRHLPAALGHQGREA